MHLYVLRHLISVYGPKWHKIYIYVLFDVKPIICFIKHKHEFKRFTIGVKLMVCMMLNRWFQYSLFMTLFSGIRECRMFFIQKVIFQAAVYKRCSDWKVVDCQYGVIVNWLLFLLWVVVSNAEIIFLIACVMHSRR